MAHGKERRESEQIGQAQMRMWVANKENNLWITKWVEDFGI